MSKCPLCTSLYLPKQLSNTQPVNCGNLTFCPYPLLTLVPAIFSLCSSSYRSTPLQTFLSVPISCERSGNFSDSGPGTSVPAAAPRFSARSLPWSLPHPLPSLQQRQHQQWLAAPSQMAFLYNFQVLTHTQNIPFCSQAPQCGEAFCQDDSPAQCRSRAQQPTKLCLFVAPLRADRNQQSCLINTFHLTPIPQEVFQVYSTLWTISVHRQALSSNTNKLLITGSALMTLQLGFPTQTIKRFNLN